MPSYEFGCENCGAITTTVLPMAERNKPGSCSLCGGHLMRRFRIGTLSFRRSWETHFNASAGAVVSNDREFDDALKRKGEAMSERLGYEHDFRRVTDPAAAGIDLARAAEQRAKTAEFVARHPGAA